MSINSTASSALRLNTDTQHNAYVLREGETEPPAGLRKALANANRLQDIVFEEIRPGRTGTTSRSSAAPSRTTVSWRMLSTRMRPTRA